MPVHSRCLGLDDVVREHVGGHRQNDGSLRIIPAQGTERGSRRVSVHDGHLDIHQDKLIIPFLRPGKDVERLFPVVGDVNGRPFHQEEFFSYFLIDFIVFHK